MLQSADSFLESGMPVELGPAIELPAASKADRSSWHEQSAQGHLASHPAENGAQSPNSAALLPVSGGTVPLVIAQHLHGWKSPPIAYSHVLQYLQISFHEPSGALKGPPCEAIARVYQPVKRMSDGVQAEMSCGPSCTAAARPLQLIPQGLIQLRGGLLPGRIWAEVDGGVQQASASTTAAAAAPHQPLSAGHSGWPCSWRTPSLRACWQRYLLP